MIILKRCKILNGTSKYKIKINPNIDDYKIIKDKVKKLLLLENNLELRNSLSPKFIFINSEHRTFLLLKDSIEGLLLVI